MRNLQQQVILGTPFLNLLMPLQKIDQTGIYCSYKNNELIFKFIRQPEIRLVNEIQTLIQYKEKHLLSLQDEAHILQLEHQLASPSISVKIKEIEKDFQNTICSDIPNAFWERKRHIVSLPYKPEFDERNQIPTKARPSQMNSEYLEMCKQEIQSLLDKRLIRKSYSPWSCTAFYVNKNAEIERGRPRLVVNYKPLNDALQWIRYPIPNKKDLLDRLYKATLFSKFDLKSGYWQIQIKEEDKYKTAFTVPFGHYEWNVMPFGLKNAPSEFQHIMNDIFNPYTEYSIVYIDDVLIFSDSLSKHQKHFKIL